MPVALPLSRSVNPGNVIPTGLGGLLSRRVYNRLGRSGLCLTSLRCWPRLTSRAGAIVRARPGRAIMRLPPLDKGGGCRLLGCQRSQKPVKGLLGKPAAQNCQRPDSQACLGLLLQQGLYLLSVEQPRLLKVIANRVFPSAVGELRPLFGKKFDGVALDPPPQLQNVPYSQIGLPLLILKHHIELCRGEQPGPLQHFSEGSGFWLGWHG